MAKDTKKIVVRTLLNLAAEKKPLSVEAVSKRSGITRNTIQKNFDNQGIEGIVNYINGTILNDINEQLFKFDPDELPIEIFADIVLTILWKHRIEAHLLFTTHIPFKAASQTVELSFTWVKKRYEHLVAEHHLAPIFSAEELLEFWNVYLYGVFSLWLNAEVPVEPEIFKPKFLYLIKTSMYDLIYKDIGIH